MVQPDTKFIFELYSVGFLKSKTFIGAVEFEPGLPENIHNWYTLLPSQ